MNITQKKPEYIREFSKIKKICSFEKKPTDKGKPTKDKVLKKNKLKIYGCVFKILEDIFRISCSPACNSIKTPEHKKRQHL